MLAWFTNDTDTPAGAADLALANLAQDLMAQGLSVAGAVQRNLDLGPDCACDMEMIVLGDSAAPVRISQSLGSGASVCRLDTGALEQAVAQTAPHLPGAGLVIIPKFGRQEATGRGFRDLIGQAMSDGQPVVLYVPRQQRDAFLEFAGDLAVQIAPVDLRAWCLDRFAVAL